MTSSSCRCRIRSSSSGAFSSVAAVGVETAAPEYARGNAFWNGYLEGGYGHPLKAWLVFEVLGMIAGN